MDTPLGAKDRVAIQIFVSRRPEAQNDGVVESSKKMFTVLPDAIPVPIAYTSEVKANAPTPIIIKGRNLKGCSLDIGQNAVLHTQSSEDGIVSGIITVSQDAFNLGNVELKLLDENNNEVGNYTLEEYSNQNSSNTPEDKLELSIASIPNQKYWGPTENGSTVSNLNPNSSLSSNSIFDLSNYVITILDETIIVEIFNEVNLVSFFDGGDEYGSQILAEVGKLFELRGSGLLFAFRAEVSVRVRVILVIGFQYDIPTLDNEFYPDFSGTLGTVILEVIIQVDVLIRLALLSALVEPDGKLQVLLTINLTAGIDFIINGSNLNFEPQFTHSVNVIGITPTPNELTPCNGRFQLASDNEQIAFEDSTGFRAFYFPRQTGDACCLSWDFNLELVRFSNGGGPIEIVQEGFQSEFCLAASAPSQGLKRIYIWSDAEPTGTPTTLEMDIGNSADLVVLAEPVDINGNSTGPAVDIKTLDHDVEFFFDDPPDVLNPSTLPEGDAQSIQEGENTVQAAVTSVQILDDGTEVLSDFSFYPDSIIGFDILRFLPGESTPRVKPAGLPVSVEAVVAADYKIEPKLAYRKTVGMQTVLVEVDTLKRLEPHEPVREYVLAAKVTAPTRTADVTFNFPVFPPPPPTPPPPMLPPKSFTIKAGANNKPLELSRMNDQFSDNRKDIVDLDKFFSVDPAKDLIKQDQLSLTILQNADLSKLIEFEKARILPNVVEEGTNALITKAVLPGKNVTGNEVKLNIKVPGHYTSNPTGFTANLTSINFDVAIQNEETYEEYFRVFYKIRNVLHPNPSPSPTSKHAMLAKFAKDFQTDLDANGFNNLIKKGEDLWKLGYEYVQLEDKDDRLLYYARIESIAVLRAYYKRQNPNSTTGVPETELNKFDWSSRGLKTQDGVNAEIDFPTTTKRKVVVTGYDPFFLNENPDVSNTSGIAALALNNDLNIPSNPAFVDAIVKTAVFPVRWRDFGNPTNPPMSGIVEGIIENVMKKAVEETSLIMTCSHTGAPHFNIDRFATRYRTTSTIDNKYKESNFNIPLGVSAPRYIENTLPYECPNVLFVSRQLNGGGYLVLDQSFSQFAGGTSAGPPVFGQPNSYEKSSIVPTPGIEVRRGSGGNYLSNEIFYRIANLRRDIQSGLPTGHLHTRPLSISRIYYPNLPGGVQRTITGQQIFQGVEHSLRLFLDSLIRVKFDDTKITTEKLKDISISNSTTSQIQITSHSFQSSTPAFELATPTPITIAAGGSKTLQVKFTPIDERRYIDTLQLKDSTGKVLYCIQPEGNGIEPLTATPADIDFPDTVITMDETETIKIKNVTANQTFIINSVEISSPFSLETSLPITLGPGIERDFVFKFSPGSVGDFDSKVKLKDASGKELIGLSANGKGAT